MYTSNMLVFPKTKESEGKEKKDNRDYKFRRDEWENYENDRRRWRVYKKFEEKEKIKEREKNTQMDNVESDEEHEPWQRKMLRFSGRFDSRRRVSLNEEKNDGAKQLEDFKNHKYKCLQTIEWEEKCSYKIASVQKNFSDVLSSIDPYPDAAGQNTFHVIKHPSRCCINVSEPSDEHSFSVATASKIDVKKKATSDRPVPLFFEQRDDDKKYATTVPLKYLEQSYETCDSAQSVKCFSSKKILPISEKNHPLNLKTLVASIPATWEGLRTHKIDWALFDQITSHGRMHDMQRWIGIKVSDLLGGEEPSMTQFIFNAVCQHTPATSLCSDLREVLEEDTEAFILKLYRMIIYEIAKALSSC